MSGRVRECLGGSMSVWEGPERFTIVMEGYKMVLMCLGSTCIKKGSGGSRVVHEDLRWSMKIQKRQECQSLLSHPSHTFIFIIFKHITTHFNN